ncbi:kinectin-like [Sceloporus undulatus]|uniref:kinectin-like n=1 Tax=Sceloporus undulatus TaxID=8520 RepID=UPI001C4C370F|nr:kinectin-like [Sceloporus undulatus]
MRPNSKWIRVRGKKLAVDLPKAEESLVTLEREIGKAAGDTHVIENSDVCSPTAGPDKNLNVAVSLNQDVAHLKKLLASVSQMLTKGKEHYQLLGRRILSKWDVFHSWDLTGVCGGCLFMSEDEEKLGMDLQVQSFDHRRRKW